MLSFQNGAHLHLATAILPGNLDVNQKRPFIGSDGNSYVMKVHRGKASKLRINNAATLQYDEWREIDRVVVEVAKQRMVGLADLRDRGLEHGLGSIGQTLSQWDRASDMTRADVSMSGVTQGQKDIVTFKPQLVPVPVVHKDFQIEMRRLAASRAFGETIDTTTAAIASRLVTEETERMLFLGTDKVAMNDPGTGEIARIYGYTTHPDRNRVNMETPWDELNGSAGENEQIIEDVLGMREASTIARYYGPWVLYIPQHYDRKMQEDYKATASASDTRTVRQRILEIQDIQDVKVADFLTGDNVVLVSMQRECVDLAVAQDITTVQWTPGGGFVEEYRVLAVWVPRIKSDHDGRCGITHLFPEAS